MTRKRPRDADLSGVGRQVVPLARWSEFEVQAYLWSELRLLMDIRGEVIHTFPDKSKVRFDLAVFNGPRLAVIIECKYEGKQRHSNWIGTQQGSRYSKFGVPVLLIRGQSEAQKLVAKSLAGGVPALLDAAAELGALAYQPNVALQLDSPYGAPHLAPALAI